eukprot:13868826-Heterocapsa_arctica.AAC.1
MKLTRPKLFSPTKATANNIPQETVSIMLITKTYGSKNTLTEKRKGTQRMGRQRQTKRGNVNAELTNKKHPIITLQ